VVRGILERLGFSQTIINMEEAPWLALIVDRHPYAPDDRGLRSMACGVTVHLTMTPSIGHARSFRLAWGVMVIIVKVRSTALLVVSGQARAMVLLCDEALNLAVKGTFDCQLEGFIVERDHGLMVAPLSPTIKSSIPRESCPIGGSGWTLLTGSRFRLMHHVSHLCVSAGPVWY
jgi:hypothetical protein